MLSIFVKSILIPYKVQLRSDDQQTAEEWRTWSIERATTPSSMRWHFIRAFELSKRAKEAVQDFRDNTMKDNNFVSIVYYSHGDEEHANYVKLQKKKFDVDHVYIQTMRADQEEFDVSRYHVFIQFWFAEVA